jgi:hypothetical protein
MKLSHTCPGKRHVAALLGLALICQTHSQASASETNTGCLSSAGTNWHWFVQRSAGTNWFVQRGAEGRIQTSLLFAYGFTCLVDVIGHTNVIAYKPLPSQAFDAQLFDSHGNAVPKTSIGRAFGKPLEVDPELLDPAHHRIMNYLRDERTLRFDLGVWERVGQFMILQSFRVKNAGEYRLRVQARVFSKDTNRVFKPYAVLPVEVPIYISEDELK